MSLNKILLGHGIAPAEYAVLFHVMDTVVVSRVILADWVWRYVPNTVSQPLCEEDCFRAIESLISKGLLEELSQSDIDVDLARWRAERLPVSWGVDRNRCPGDIDVTEAGFLLYREIGRAEQPSYKPSPVSGYNDETPGTIQVLGETEEACQRHVEWICKRLSEAPWCWQPGAALVEPMRPIGPWWYSRHHRVPQGFESVVRRDDR